MGGMAFLHIFSGVGHVGQVLLPLGAGLYAYYSGYQKECLALGASAGVMKMALLASKHFIASPRPYPHAMLLDSFPSGHTAGAFLAVGFAFAIDCLDAKPLFTGTQKAAIFGLALITGISRYVAHMHWPIDIAAGALLGLICGVSAVVGSRGGSKGTELKGL